MTLAALAVRNLARNSSRAALTAAGIAVAMLAFLLLRTVLWSWTVGAEHARQDRLATRHRTTFAMTLPRRYVEEVRAVPGVRAATPFNWFGGRVPGREGEFFVSLLTDPETLLDVLDELDVSAEQRKRWQADRQGALVGAQLARQFGWKVGDRVTLKGTSYPGDWELTVDGIYSTARKSQDQSTMYVHWKYVNESPGLAAPRRDRVGWIMSKIDVAARSAGVAKAIDGVFEERDLQTLTISERAMSTSFVGMLGTLLEAVNAASIVIVAIMMLILGNTVAMTVRERTREYGVLRAIGFGPYRVAALVVGESIAIAVVGAVVGIAAAYPIVNQGVGAFMEDNFSGFFPHFELASSEALAGLLVTVVAAALAAGIPAYRAGRLNVTEALRWTD